MRQHTEPEKGLIMVNTGAGKGKTTAAFGQVLRAVGQDRRVVIIQFIKGKWPTGETRAIRRYIPAVELHVTGSGFTWEADDKAEVMSAGQRGWRLAREKIISGDFQLVVLDELTYLIQYQIISEREVLDVLELRPGGVDVLITGRGVSSGITAAADLVTEFKEIKHPFSTGGQARRGIEY